MGAPDRSSTGQRIDARHCGRYAARGRGRIAGAAGSLVRRHAGSLERVARVRSSIVARGDPVTGCGKAHGSAAVADPPESGALEGAFAQVSVQWFSSLRSRLQFTLQRDAGEGSDSCHPFVQQTRIYHAVGTCRMGSDPASVVDPRLRANGIERLRVADASVMPT